MLSKLFRKIPTEFKEGVKGLYSPYTKDVPSLMGDNPLKDLIAALSEINELDPCFLYTATVLDDKVVILVTNPKGKSKFLLRASYGYDVLEDYPSIKGVFGIRLNMLRAYKELKALYKDSGIPCKWKAPFDYEGELSTYSHKPAGGGWRSMENIHHSVILMRRYLAVLETLDNMKPKEV